MTATGGRSSGCRLRRSPAPASNARSHSDGAAVSHVSVQKYIDAAQRGVPDGMRSTPWRSVSRAPRLLDAFAERCAPRIRNPDDLVVSRAQPAEKKPSTPAIATPTKVAATARGVADCTRVDDMSSRIRRGRTPGAMDGPTVEETSRAIGRGVRKFLVAPNRVRLQIN